MNSRSLGVLQVFPISSLRMTQTKLSGVLCSELQMVPSSPQPGGILDLVLMPPKRRPWRTAHNGVAALCQDPRIKLHLEADCQMLVKGLKSAAKDRSELCFILRDIDMRMRTFDKFSCSWIGRLGNSLAHCIAQHARNSNSMGALTGD